MSDPTPTPTPLRLRKKPVVVDAIRYDGEFPLSFLGDRERVGSAGDGTGALLIHTLEGTMRAEVGDYIIRGVKGELYPCKPDIVAATYEDAALAATGDAPLAREIIDAIEHPDFTSPEHLHRAAKRLLTAYTTLAAQLAAARTERDALREAVRCLNGLTLEHERDLAYYEAELGVTRRRTLAPDEVPALDAEILRVNSLRGLIISALELRRIGAIPATPARPTDTGRDG